MQAWPGWIRRGYAIGSGRVMLVHSCEGPASSGRFGGAGSAGIRVKPAEFTRQAPGRHAARLLLATGPVVGACWAAALTLGRAWTWPLPSAARLSFGAVLLLAVLALALAATSQRRYHRTRLTAAASPILLALDTTAVAAVLLDAPALTRALGTAVAASLTRIAFTARSLPRIATR
jgi:hypothetical protein